VDVPRPVSQNLTALKHGLRNLIGEVVGARDSASADARTLEARVIARLENEDIPIEDDDAKKDEGSFGAITGIRLRRPPEYPDWLIATTTLDSLRLGHIAVSFRTPGHLVEAPSDLGSKWVHDHPWERRVGWNTSSPR